LDDITFRPYGPTILAGFGDVTSTADRDLCVGESGTYTLKASQAGYTDPYYQWQVNKNDGKGWLDINEEKTTTFKISITHAVANTNQYRIGILNGSASAIACRIYSKPLTVNVNAFPVVNIAPKTIVCETQVLRLTATGGTDYYWTGPNAFISPQQSPVVSYAADNSKAGVYTVTVTTKGCVSSLASTTVSVLPNVKATISNDVTICEGSTTQLVAGGGMYYKWTPSEGLNHDDIANPIARPLVTTTYHVRVYNDGCFDESKLVTVKVLKIPVANAGANITMNEGETVKLNGTVAGDNITYYWTPADNLDNALLLSPKATPKSDITYTLHVQSQDCGIATDEVFVRVYKKITIPNAFSPNNDGVNDLWNIDQLITYPECVLTIFTRSGGQVYRSLGYTKAWNGNYQGQALPAGIYYYTIDLKNNTTVRSGWVMIVR
jgi:gliding motility-associated-like protein